MRKYLGMLLLVPSIMSAAGPTDPLPREFLRLQLMQPLMQPLKLQESAPASGERKKAGLAILYSLAVPGMGELYADNFSSGKYFLIAEGVLWLSYAVFDVHGNALRDDARSFAAARAGVLPAGKGDQFYVDIGNFANLDEYNDKKLRDREPELLYSAAAGYGWQWGNDTDRLMFRDQRISADNWLNDRKFVIAVILVNHIASAINAARAAITHNNALSQNVDDLSLHASVLGGVGHAEGILLTFTKTF
jgi:hypothetical protein